MLLLVETLELLDSGHCFNEKLRCVCGSLQVAIPAVEVAPYLDRLADAAWLIVFKTTVGVAILIWFFIIINYLITIAIFNDGVFFADIRHFLEEVQQLLIIIIIIIILLGCLFLGQFQGGCRCLRLLLSYELLLLLLFAKFFLLFALLFLLLESLFFLFAKSLLFLLLSLLLFKLPLLLLLSLFDALLAQYFFLLQLHFCLSLHNLHELGVLLAHFGHFWLTFVNQSYQSLE